MIHIDTIWIPNEPLDMRASFDKASAARRLKFAAKTETLNAGQRSLLEEALE